MTQTHLENLIRVYNALLGISTKGEDTVMMGQCLAVMRETLTEVQNAMSADAAPVAEDAVEE
jgi:hypothetical protein